MEIKSREFVGKLWLASRLAQRGHEVLTGRKDDAFTTFDVLEPDVYFELGPVSRDQRLRRLERLRDCGTTILLLDTEGAALTTEAYHDRVDADVLELVDHYLAWGRRSADIAAETNGDTAVTVTGNPRFDLLSPELRTLYRGQAADYRERYGDYVLVNTSFGVNHHDIDHHREYTQHDDVLFRHQSILLGQLVSAVGEVSERLPDTEFVVRPHPTEEPATYEQLCWPFENVSVESGGDVVPWLYGARAVVHNSCTTGVEATLLEKPVIAFDPSDRTDYYRELPNLLSETAQTADELVPLLEAADGQRPLSELDAAAREALADQFYNLEGFAADRIADVVDGVGTADGESFGSVFRPGPGQRAKRVALRVLGEERYDRYYRKGVGRQFAFESAKFPETSVGEVQATIRQFQHVFDNTDFTVSRLPRVENTYRITASESRDRRT